MWSNIFTGTGNWEVSILSGSTLLTTTIDRTIQITDDCRIISIFISATKESMCFAHILKIIPAVDPKTRELNLYCSKHNYFTTYSFPRQHVFLLPLWLLPLPFLTSGFLITQVITTHHNKNQNSNKRNNNGNSHL